MADCENRRSIMPAVYNSKTSSGRTTEQLHLITPQEFDVAMATTSTELIGRADVKIEGYLEEVSDLRKRCATRRPQAEESTVEINDSDIEDIQDDIGDADSEYEIELLMPKPIIKEEPIMDAGNSVDDGDVLSPNRPGVVESSDQLSSGSTSNNQNMLNDSNETYCSEVEAAARNEVSSSLEMAHQAVEDALSGNLHYAEDVSMSYTFY